MLFVLCRWLSERAPLKLKLEYVILFIGSMLIVIVVLFDPTLFGFHFISYYFLFFSFGYFFNKYSNQITIKNPVLLLSLAVSFAFLSWFWQMHELPFFLKGIPFPKTILQYAYRFMTASIATFLLLLFAPRLLNSPKKWNRLLCELGKVSLGIYTAHFILIEFIVKFLNKLNLGSAWIIFISFLLAIIVSWVIVYFLSKLKVTSVWLLGKI